MNSTMPPVVSQLMKPLAPTGQAGAQLASVQGDGLAMLVLEMISLGLVQSPEDVQLLLLSSLWALQQKDRGAVATAAQKALRMLGEKQLIKWQAPRPHEPLTIVLAAEPLRPLAPPS